MLLLEVKPIFRYVYHIAPAASVSNIKKVGLLQCIVSIDLVDFNWT